MITAQQLAAGLRAFANAIDAAPAAPATAPQQQFAGQPAAQPVQQPVSPPPPPPPAASNVSSEQLVALIQPHVGNPAIKDALGVAMRSMGINALPEAQPHQFAALYQAFQNVIAQFAGGAAQPQPTAASII